MGDSDYTIGRDIADLHKRMNDAETRLYAVESPPDYSSFTMLRDEMASMLAEARALLGGAAQAAELAATTTSETATTISDAIDAIAEASTEASEEVAEAVGELPAVLANATEDDTAPKKTSIWDRKLLG